MLIGCVQFVETFFLLFESVEELTDRSLLLVFLHYRLHHYFPVIGDVLGTKTDRWVAEEGSHPVLHILFNVVQVA